MKIKLPKDLIELLDPKLLQKCGCVESRKSWQKFEEIDMMTVELELLEELEVSIKDVVKKSDKIRGTRKCLRDMGIWIKALKHGYKSDTKCKKEFHFFSMLISYLAQIPGHRFFMQEEDRDFNACYFAQEIIYHPLVVNKKWGNTPPYVSLHYTWVQFGGRCRNSMNFHWGQMRGKTVGEILVDAGVVVETPELRIEYLQEKERFEKETQLLGKQFIAEGYATDDVDGNKGGKRSWWQDDAWINLSKNEEGSNVVIDVFKESDDNDRDKDSELNTEFWRKFEPKDDIDFKMSEPDAIVEDDDEDEYEEDSDDDDNEDEEETSKLKNTLVEVPLHALLVVFDLKKHRRLKVHINQLTEYKYDKNLGSKLILPAENHELIETLLAHNKATVDIIKGKGSSSIILCAGIPGTGKTLTAEVFSEVVEKPLYSVQCSQLGLSADELEEELLKIFARAQRWKAILLLDEADVYIRRRGDDLEQNAIVGVFLRTLEYFNGVLFLTTNRPETVDDAIASRCLAKIVYGIPTVVDQAKIWKVLSETNGLKIEPEEMKKISEQHQKLTGRDVKNLLKLASMIASSKKIPVTADLIAKVKKFKPTEGE